MTDSLMDRFNRLFNKPAAESDGELFNVTTRRDVDGGITKIDKVTQAQYDALVIKDPNTLYVVIAG